MERGCTQCFLPGTRVLMADGGSLPIEKVAAGDLVRATDPETGETAARRVTQQIVTQYDDKYLAALTIRGPTGERAELSATYEHPFWSTNLHAWVPAQDLRPGDSLRTDSGRTATVLANRAYTRATVTYSLTVAGLHSFYVLAGQTPVLVHNSECKVLVLGVTEHIGDATTELKGYHFMDEKYKAVEAYLPGGIPYTRWMSEVEGVMRENGKIAVSLKGFDPPTGTYQQKFELAVTNGQGTNWKSTEWEMAQIVKYNKRGNLDWDHVKFYDDNGIEVKIDPPK
ncbi:polymorphic toxin-type HINT domain-containing protein [Streptomyces sp. NPDC002088]|uniref:polymorphic toxin-type HINT domain-containing protein n=1 Tax=Streptomyces sp. NPDC002088 TaxID=3154665 RepID=UPI003320DBDB